MRGFLQEQLALLSAIPWQSIYRIITVANLTLVVGLFTLIAAVASVVYTAFEYNIHSNEYAEQSFERSQGSINLAWHTLDEANNHAYEVGQSAALLYLANVGQLNGNLTLVNTSIEVNAYDKATDKVRNTYINLTNSLLCGTTISGSNVDPGTYDFSHSIMRNGKISGYFISDDFVGADLQGVHFDNVDLKNSRLAASILENAVLHGGKFVDVDFEGATLRGLTTERGYMGFGSKDFGSTFWTYTPDTPIQWPLLFDKNKGQAEVLETLGMAHDPSGDNYIVDFTSSNFTDADIRGAHLENSNITQKQVNQACADSTTVLRAGVKVEEPCTTSPRADELHRADELRKVIRVYSSHSANSVAAECIPRMPD